MNIIEYADAIENGCWIDEIIKEKKDRFSPVSSKLMEIIIEKIKASIVAKDKASFVNWVVLGVYFDEDKTLALIRKRGIFRKSKYDFEKSVLLKGVEFILGHAEDLKLGHAVQEYLGSLINMYRLSIQVSGMYIELNNFLRSAEPNLLKTLLCYLDAIFMFDYHPTPNTPELTKEELSEAISFMVFLLKEKQGISAVNLGNIDEELIASDKLNTVIVLACKIKFYMRSEILVDYFNYSVLKQDDLFLFVDKTEDLAKSIQLGFIRTEIQRYNTQVKSMAFAVKSESLVQFAKQVYEKYKGKMFIVKTEPHERLVSLFPPEALKTVADMEGFFQEELQLLAELNNELYVTLEDLKTFYVKGDLSLYDLIKVKRIFSFMTTAFSEFLKSRVDEDRLLVLRSLLPIMKKEDVLSILRICLSSDNKAQSWIDTMSWSAEEDEILDLQYTPLIPVEDRFFVLANVLDASNIVRNALCSEQKRIFHDGKYDPLSKMLEEELKDCGFIVSTQIKYKYHGEEGDIDVLARSGNSIFVFECKNSMLPGNIPELRTSYDYIVKGAEQLDRFMRLAVEKEFVDLIFNKIGWENEDCYTYKGCIVFGNRTFYGLRHHGYTILHVRELLNFIANGDMVFQGETCHVRKPGTMTASVLNDFIDDNLFHRLTANSTAERFNSTKFKNKDVVIKTYVLETDLLDKNYKEYFGGKPEM
ncbi:hypothetical protein GMSM_43490 [Geomonas sp. Red276]